MDPLKRALFSTSRMVKSGFRIVHDDVSYMECKRTGVKYKIYERGGVYVIPVWIKVRSIAPSSPNKPFFRRGAGGDSAVRPSLHPLLGDVPDGGDEPRPDEVEAEELQLLSLLSGELQMEGL